MQDLVSKLLSLIGTNAASQVSEDKENDAILVDVKSENEAGLLIGNRGETLSSLQVLLGVMFRKKRGDWKRILVNVADWREKEKGRLEELAIQTAERARETGEPQTLYNLDPGQRRIIHVILSENNNVETESFGEGEERYLIVRPKGKPAKKEKSS